MFHSSAHWTNLPGRWDTQKLHNNISQCTQTSTIFLQGRDRKGNGRKINLTFWSSIFSCVGSLWGGRLGHRYTSLNLYTSLLLSSSGLWEQPFTTCSFPGLWQILLALALGYLEASIASIFPIWCPLWSALTQPQPIWAGDLDPNASCGIEVLRDTAQKYRGFNISINSISQHKKIKPKTDI